MSTAKCDRCGKRFEITTGAVSLDEYRADDEGEFGCEASDKHDLCPECSDRFRDFMKGSGVEK